MHKKKFLAVVIATLALAMVLASTACNPADVKDYINEGIGIIQLQVPGNVRIEGNELCWNPVENATRYLVSIDNKEYYCEDYSYSIAGVSDGKHIFKVKAVGDGVVYSSSQFSSEIEETFEEGGKRVEGYYSQFDDLTKNESFLGYGFDVINSSVFSDKYVMTSSPLFKYGDLMQQRLVKVDSKYSSVEEIASSEIKNFMSSWNASANVDVGWGGDWMGGSVQVEAKYSGGSETARSKYYHCISFYNQKFYLVLQSDINTYRNILTDSFKNDLYSNIEPAELFRNYGTHFITSAIMGGKINSYYLYTSESETTFHDISGSVSVEVRRLPTTVNVDVSGGYRSEAQKQNIYIKNQLEVLGGDDFGMISDADIPRNYLAWEKSLNNHASLIGIKDAGSLRALWDLIDPTLDTERTYSYTDENGKLIDGLTRSEQLQGYFMTYGIKSYNDLMKNAGLPEIIEPNEITDVKVNGKDSDIYDNFTVYSGSNNKVSFGILPHDATGYTKNISISTDTNYASVGTDGMSIDIDKACPDDTVIQVVLSAGAVRKTIRLKVVHLYSIELRLNGGTISDDVIQSFKNLQYNDWVYTPAEPEREGWLFKGWYSDGKLTVPFEEGPIESDMTIYAKWEAFYPTVTYVHNVPYEGQTVEKVAYNSTLNLQELYQYGYEFVNYYADKEMLIPFDKETAIKQDTTIYVKWTPVIYTVSFDSNGGTAVNDQNVEYGKYATRPGDPTKEGNTFEDWYADAALTKPFTFSADKIVGDVTLYAKWGTNIVTVKVNLNGGTGMDEEVSTEYGTSLGNKLRDPEKLYYKFDGWYQDNNFTLSIDKTTIITNNIEIYAKWKENSYTLKFNSNSGIGEMNTIQCIFGEIYNLPECKYEKRGSHFAGWSFYSEKQEVDYLDKSAFALTLDIYENIEFNDHIINLYALWEKNTYTIIYNSNGGLGTMAPSHCIYDTATKLTKNNFEKNGYNFLGWSTFPNGTVLYKDEQLIKNLTEKNGEIINLFAVWEGIKYTVEYNGNGGSGTTNASTHVYGVYHALTKNCFTKNNYVFIGWSTKNNGNVIFTNEAEVLNLSDIDGTTITLFAVWLKIGDTLIYSVENGKRDVTITDGDKYTEIINPLELNRQNLLNHGYTKLSVTITFDCKEIDDGYQKLWVYSYNTNRELYNFTFEHTRGKKDTTWWAHSVTFEISLDNVDPNCGGFWLRWGAEGDWADDWKLGYTTITIIAK